MKKFYTTYYNNNNNCLLLKILKDCLSEIKLERVRRFSVSDMLEFDDSLSLSDSEEFPGLDGFTILVPLKT